MRIALVIERFEPLRGGVENVGWTVAHALARGGDDVAVIARTADPSADTSVRVQCLNVGTTWQPLRVLRFSRGAARAAARERFDVVYSLARTAQQHVYRAGAGSHARYMEQRYGARHRLHAASPRHAALLALERRVFRDPAQIVLCNSEMVRRELSQQYAIPDARLALVRNGVDVARFNLDPAVRSGERERLREELGAGVSRVALFTGSGFARKGLDTAIQAIAAARTDVQLWVAGADRHTHWRRLANRAGVASRVRFLGFRSDMARLYAAADSFLLPTRYDACSNACLEAAAAGLPVLTTPSNGAAEVLAGDAAVIEDAEDSAAFARALDGLDDEDRRREMGEASRKAASALDWREHISQLRKVFAGVRA
jgi:UDP-glucose:(heptosyl)LPS alpha-1,3-glucosyltransferase